MEKKWIYPQVREEPFLNELAVGLEVSPLVARLLATRGIRGVPEGRLFLKPTLADLHDPFLLPDMEQTVARIQLALGQKQRVMIYGDYDVDGITGTALLYRGLSRFGADVTWYLPSRAHEGYGISTAGIDEAARRGVKLIISVDCGITAHDEVEYARGLGIDCIITDHHETKESLPRAVAVLDPKRSDSGYPYQELAGVGVAYKLLQGVYRRMAAPEDELERHLDLVALGTIADIVPLTGENRIFARFGLELFKNSPKPGIRALLEVAGLGGRSLDSAHIVFMLGPRINAAGRMGNADASLMLMITEDQDQADAIARTLDEENRKRKEIDDRILGEAMEQVERQVDLARERVIVLASDTWHQGVIGIVASRLVERYYRPTILISVAGDRGKGSARSISSFHLHQALRDCQDCLLAFGGHKYAAGLTIETGRIPEFRSRLNEVASRTLLPEDLVPTQQLDAEVDLEGLDFKVSQGFSLFAPFGPGNRHPVLAARQLRVVGSPYVVGKNHLKLKVKQRQKIFDTIGFSMGELLEEVEDPEAMLDLAFVLEENEWQGRRKLQLRIKDLKVR